MNVQKRRSRLLLLLTVFVVMIAQRSVAQADTLAPYIAQAYTAEEWYQVARAFGLAQQPDSALVYLQRAIKQGHSNTFQIRRDSAFRQVLHTQWRWRVVAQTYAASNPQRIDTIAQLFQKVPDIGPENYIPYYDGAQAMYGYLHRETREILIPPTFFDASLIGTCGYVILPKDNLILRLNHLGQIANEVELLNTTYYGLSFIEPLVPVLPELPNRGGFSVFNRKLVGIAPGYFSTYHGRHTGYEWGSYDGPFWYQDKPYLIIQEDLTGLRGIIDEQGQPLPGYDFRTKYLYLAFANQPDPILMEETDSSTLFFTVSGSTIKEFSSNTVLAISHLHPWGFELVEVNEYANTGLWDLKANRWILEPAQRITLRLQVQQADACYELNGEVRPGIAPATLLIPIMDEFDNIYFRDEAGTIYQPRSTND